MYPFDPKLINLPSALIKRIFIISLVILCGACAAPKEKPVEQAKEKNSCANGGRSILDPRLYIFL
jgi:hypothetical protein